MKVGLVLTLLLIGAVLSSFLPLPFGVLSGLLALAALVCSIVAIVVGVRAGQASQAVVTGIIGILVSGYVLATAGATAAVWPIRADYEECLSQAITEQAQATCENTYDTAVADWYENLTGTTLPGSDG